MASITKFEAAIRQLDAAIRLNFAGYDSVVVHTLAGAASLLLSSLVKLHAPGFSWDEMAAIDSKLTETEYFQIIRKEQNFLKHADRDPDDTLDLNVGNTDALIMMAVMNASEISTMTPASRAFQLWYLARICPVGLEAESPFCDAIATFGDLRTLDRAEAILKGRLVLQKHAK
jgi:hypothetical protein